MTKHDKFQFSNSPDAVSPNPTRTSRVLVSSTSGPISSDRTLSSSHPVVTQRSAALPRAGAVGPRPGKSGR